ncbi:hypothetical protein D3C87_176420 [compost metagenome]
MLKKIFLALVALFFIFIGGIWLLVSYMHSNPDSVFRFMDQVIERFTAGQPYEEKSEENLHNIQHVLIRTENSNLEIVPSDKEVLEILYTGKAPSMESGPFIEEILEGVKLEVRLHEPMSSHFFRMNINGEDVTKASNVALIAKIFIPKKYNGVLRVETNRGNVQMQVPPGKLYEFDLRSDRGLVENTAVQNPEKGTVNPNEVGQIQIITQSGNITVTN